MNARTGSGYPYRRDNLWMPRWLVGLGLGGLFLLISGITAALVTSSRPHVTTEEAGPPARGFAASGPAWDSLPELIAKSDLIVIGTVKGSFVGETVNDDPEYPSRFLHTLVAVDENLKGSALGGLVSVHTNELAFGGAPHSREWRKPGERVLLFLTPSTETAGLHILANRNLHQTAYLIRGEDLEWTAREPGYPLSERIAARSVSELRAAVRGTE